MSSSSSSPVPPDGASHPSSSSSSDTTTSDPSSTPRQVDQSRSMLYQTMGTDSSQLYEYLFRDEEEDNDSLSLFHVLPPSLVTTQPDEDEFEEEEEEFFPSRIQQEDHVQRQAHYVLSLERRNHYLEQQLRLSQALETPKSRVPSYLVPTQSSFKKQSTPPSTTLKNFRHSNSSDASPRINKQQSPKELRLQQELQDALSKVSALQAELQRVQQELLQEKQALLHSQTSEMDTVLVLERDLRTCQHELTEARQQLAHVQQTQEALQHQLQDSQAVQQAQVEQLTQQLEESQQQQQEWAKQSSTLTKQTELLQSELLSWKESYGECQKELRVAQAALTKEREWVQEHTEQTRTLNEELGQSQEELGQVQKELVRHQEERAAEQTTMARDKEALQTELLSLKDSFQRKTTELEQQHDEQMRQQQLESRRDLEAERAHRVRVQRQKELLETELCSVKDLNALRETELQEQHVQLEEYQQKVNELQTDLSQQKEQLEAAKVESEGRKSRLGQDYKELEQHLKELLEEWSLREDDLLAQLSDQKNLVEDVQRRRRALESEVDALRKRAGPEQGTAGMDTFVSVESASDSFENCANMPSPVVAMIDHQSELECTVDESMESPVRDCQKLCQESVDNSSVALVTVSQSPSEHHDESISERRSLAEVSLELGSSLLGLLQAKESNGEQEGDVLEQLEAVSNFLDHVDIHAFLQDEDADKEERQYDEERNALSLERFHDLQQRVQFLEDERTVLLTETLDLLESAREANSLEMDVFKKDLERQAAKEVEAKVHRIMDVFGRQVLQQDAFQKWQEFVQREAGMDVVEGM